MANMDYKDIPVLGPVLGGIFGFGSDDVTNAGKRQEKLFKQLAQQYEEQRAPTMEARLQALRQTMSLFEPMNAYMKKWYGYEPYSNIDMNEILAHPYKGPRVDPGPSLEQKEYQAMSPEEQRRWKIEEGKRRQGSK